MSPKLTNKVKEDQGDSNMSESYYPSLHSRTLSNLSVDEILFKYQDNSQLLNHILVAKAQEDKVIQSVPFFFFYGGQSTFTSFLSYLF